MPILYAMLRDKTIDGVRRTALGWGATFFSVLNVAVYGMLRPSGFWEMVSTFILSVLSLAALVSMCQHLFLKAWAKPVLGRWIYESSSGNWGLARLEIRGGDLNYSVQLYRTEAEALGALKGVRGTVSSCFATVTSGLVDYAAGRVELIYKIDHTSSGYESRSGMLSLSPLSSRTMKGYWKSDVRGDEPQRGVLNMARVETFRGHSGQ